MEKQLNALSNMGLLSRFIGMLTDSRSFLSFPRHEYFRRILCQLIGDDVEKGLLPADIQWLGSVAHGTLTVWLVWNLAHFDLKRVLMLLTTPATAPPAAVTSTVPP